MPWLVAAGLVAIVSVGVLKALRSGDPVKVAEALRKGDVEAERPKDPTAAIDVLDRVLADEPRNVPALIERARAWQDLRAWDNAIQDLDTASDVSADIAAKITAKTMAMNLLATADEYDKAVEKGQEIVSLQPGELVHKLRLGPVYLKGSVSAQEEALGRLMDRSTRDLRDLKVEKKIESWVTDLWSDTAADGLVAELAPGSDAVFREHLTVSLVAARQRFRQADEVLSGFNGFGGFEPNVARAWCQVLLRSGRLFDAHVEAGMVLREPSLSTPFKRDFLEIQARCAIAVDDWKQAANLYAATVAAYLADPQLPQVPSQTVWTMYDARARAGEWDWILAHVDADMLKYGKDDPVMRWARAAALDGKGETEKARAAVIDAFDSATLSSRASLPGSLKLFPERRRAIAMTGYKLFTATGDTSLASSALDALLAMDGADAEALRLRADMDLSQKRYEQAAADSLALLVLERRDRADFDRWMQASDLLFDERNNVSLADSARAKVAKSSTLQRSVADAQFESFKTLGLKVPKNLKANDLPTDPLYPKNQPALCFAIVDELVAQGDVERARTELRKLSDDHPEVQEFRFRLGKLLVREGQFEFAAEEFNELLAAIPGDTEVLDFAVRTQLALDRPQEAAALVTRTILADPLGAGAVRYGQRLLERGRAEQAQKLVERVARWPELAKRLDVLLLAARAHLALGKVDDAAAILGSLATAYPDSFDVALLGLDVGLAKEQEGLVSAAVSALQPIAPELFPDQLEMVAQRLLEAERYAELVRIFDDTVCSLPAAQLSLRDVAQARKALGEPGAADTLLAGVDDDDAIVDRFLLLSLQGQPDEASRRMRLQPEAEQQARDRTELCLLAANALMDLRALQDATPLEKLLQLHADETLPPVELELFDALLRILPGLQRLDDVLPRAAVEDPGSTYPHAGRDVAALLALAATDTDAARRAGADLLYLLLMQDRPFWAAESRQLAEHALAILPSLAQPARILARRDLLDGTPRDALVLLQPLLSTGQPDPEDLRTFLQAARDFEHAEWGVALALFFEDQPPLMTVLADTLAEWGHVPEALYLYEQILAQSPDDPHVQAGRIIALTTLHRNEEAEAACEKAINAHPEDEEVAQAVGRALAGQFRVTARAQSMMTFLWKRHEDLDQVGEALARANAEDPARLAEVLDTLIERNAARPMQDDPDLAAASSQALVRAARTARDKGLLEQARRLCELALRTEPGAIGLYREMGFLELQLGQLQEARNYLEVLSFVDIDDRDAAMELARLDFRQLGQPVRAADVVRRTFTGTVPPDMVEILAAEAWLLGRPQDAVNQFIQVSKSPLISADTYMTVLRISYAAALDDVARFVADLALKNMAAEDPRRPRVEFLLDKRLPKPTAKPTAAN